LLSFIIVNGAVIKLRRERPNMNRPYTMPYYPIPAILGIVLNAVLTVVLVAFLIEQDPLALVLSVGWIVLGVVAYFALNAVRSPATQGAGTDTTISEGGDD
jgi:amino acid transporter